MCNMYMVPGPSFDGEFNTGCGWNCMGRTVSDERRWCVWLESALSKDIMSIM
jgi:hypothetical protein